MSTEEPALAIQVGDRKVSGLWKESAAPEAVCVIAHGAGTDMRHPFYAGIADGLAGERVSSLRFNFPYMEEGRRPPDRAPLLMSTWRSALDAAARLGGRLPLVASGKSLGARIASLVAAEDGEAFASRALVFFGYPLHGPGRTKELRDEHLFRIAVPILFIEGTRDPFARYDLVESTVKRLGPRARLVPVEGGDHSFRVRRQKRPDDEIGRQLAGVAGEFIAEVVIS